MFRLARQIIDDEMSQIIEREIELQEIDVTTASKKMLSEMKKVCEEIESNELPSYFCRLPLPKNLGEGLFLRADAKPIPKGAVIAPYAGVVSIVQQNAPDEADYAFEPLDEMFLTKAEQKKYDGKSPFRPARQYSLKLDAFKTGNFTRSINHSEEPNVESELIQVKNNKMGLEPMCLEVVYFAKKTILPGEQLLVSYEGEPGSYWDNCDYEQFHMTPRTFMVDKDLNLITNLSE